MIDKLDTSHEAVKKTGKAFLIAGCVIGAVLFLSNSAWFKFEFQQGVATNGWKWFVGSGLILFTLSRVAYPIMKPIHYGWMTFAFALGWVNTRLLLGFFYYFIVTPIGLMMRLFGKDLINKKIDKSATSYWIKRDVSKFDPKHAARTF